MSDLSKHIIAIFQKCPFLYEIAMYHQYEASTESVHNGKPTMRCDGRRVQYHPDVLKWSADQIKGTLVHEWMHTGHHHHARGHAIPGVDWGQWNIACDAVINPMVRTFGFVIKGVDIPGAENMTAEQVYKHLMQKKQKPTPPPDRPGPMQRPAPGDQPGDQGEQSEPGDMPEPGQSSEVVPATTRETEVSAMLARLASMAKAAGKLPAGMELEVNRWLKPKVDWRAVLREFCTRVNKDGWSYERTNRSYAARGIYIPGRRSKNLGDVVIVRDTSGSLIGKQSEIVAEAMSILSECRPTRTIVIDCDAQVHQVVEIGPGETMPVRALGGGGTDFRPVFTEVTKRQYQPEVMVFVTDLFGDFPDAPPGYPVLWALIGACDQVPPWGSHVVIEP